jgi:hypothetical protein
MVGIWNRLNVIKLFYIPTIVGGMKEQPASEAETTTKLLQG